MTRQERLVQGFLELVRIDSPTLHELELSNILKQKLSTLGFEIEEDSAGFAIGGNANNIFAFLKGTATNAHALPTIMLSAHMDCVDPCLGVEPQVIDGVVSSKGDTVLGSDDKSGIIAILEGIRRLQEDNIALCNIQVILTVAEEGGVNGTKNMDKNLIKADFGYVLDAGGPPGKITYAAPGINKFHVKITGKAAHAGIAPEAGINAIVVAANALQKFPQGRKDAETTANVGIIQGGLATNIVPELVEVVCEARSLEANSLDDISKEIVQVFEQSAKEHGATVQIDVEHCYASYKLEHDMPAILLAKKAAENIGLDVEIKSTGGGSDANHFNAYGLPSVPLGTGMSKVHTKDEFIRVEHLEQLCVWVESILKLASSDTK